MTPDIDTGINFEEIKLRAVNITEHTRALGEHVRSAREAVEIGKQKSEEELQEADE